MQEKFDSEGYLDLCTAAFVLVRRDETDLAVQDDRAALATAAGLVLERTLDAFAANVLPIVEQIQAAGAVTYRAIAAALNGRGVRTAPGGA